MIFSKIFWGSGDTTLVGQYFRSVLFRVFFHHCSLYESLLGEWSVFSAEEDCLSVFSYIRTVMIAFQHSSSHSYVFISEELIPMCVWRGFSYVTHLSFSSYFQSVLVVAKLNNISSLSSVSKPI